MFSRFASCFEAMSSPLKVTSEGEEGTNEESVDYVKLVTATLKEKKLLYIADILFQYDSDITIDELLKWNRKDIVDTIKMINDDENNKHEINPLHKNKFAKLVEQVAAKQKEELEKQQVAPSASTPSSQMKLLFLGKEEEEAVEAIKNGQKYMEQSVKKMPQLFNNLDENTKNVQQDVIKLCDSLKQQIDIKQKDILAKIKFIHQYRWNQLNQRNETTKSTAKVVSKVKNIYFSMSLCSIYFVILSLHLKYIFSFIMIMKVIFVMIN